MILILSLIILDFKPYSPKEKWDENPPGGLEKRSQNNWYTLHKWLEVILVYVIKFNDQGMKAFFPHY